MFGPMSVASSRGSPWRSAAARTGEARGELAGDRLVDQQPGAGQAHLARVVELADRVADGQVQVGVGEHEQRRLPAEFQRDRRELRAGRGGDLAAGGHRAGEGDPGQIRVRHQRRSRLRAQALDDVEHAVGQPGVPGDVREQAGGQRRPLGRLGDDGVPGRERGRDAPGREHQRGVPRGDHRGDAGRIPGDLLGVPGDLHGSPGRGWPSQSAKNSKLCATLGITLRRCERSSEPLSQVSTWASSSIRARTPAPIARSTAARSSGGVAAQPVNAAFAALTAAATSAGPAPGHLGDGGLVYRGEVRKRGGRGDAAATDPMAGVHRDAGHVRRARGQADHHP